MRYNSKKIFYSSVKRLFDIVVSSVLIVLLAVPFAVIAAVIKIDSPGQVIFKQHRVGRGGRMFVIFKFRTMYITAPQEIATGNLEDAKKHITKVGAFLRKTSIDELPQVFNVFKGDMSLVGPRPLVRTETDMHELRREAGVYAIRPGVTGWAQINGRDLLKNEDKIALDVEYMKNRSFWFDIFVLLKTVGVILAHKDVVEGKRT